MDGTPLEPHDIKTYQSLVGSFLWINRGSRPDISYHTWLLATAMSKPTNECLYAAKHLARYLSGTKDWKITYSKNKLSKLDLSKYNYDSDDVPAGFSDSNWAVPKSVSSILVMVCNAAVFWSVKKQGATALSSVESELCALSECSAQLQYTTFLFHDMGHDWYDAFKSYCDSGGAIQNAKHPIVKQNLKHVEAKIFHVRDTIDMGHVSVHKIAGTDNPSDLGTKILGHDATIEFSGFYLNFG